MTLSSWVKKFKSTAQNVLNQVVQVGLKVEKLSPAATSLRNLTNILLPIPGTNWSKLQPIDLPERKECAKNWQRLKYACIFEPKSY